MRTIITVLIAITVMPLAANAGELRFKGGLEHQLRVNKNLLSLADMIQTCRIKDTPNVWEMNPVLGKQPHTEKVVPYFVLSMVAHDYITQRYFNKTGRLLSYGAVLLLEGYLVLDNNPKKGIKSPNIYIQFTVEF